MMTEKINRYYSRSQCIPIMENNRLAAQDGTILDINKLNDECRCIKKSICIRLIQLLKHGHIKEAEKEYKKFYK